MTIPNQTVAPTVGATVGGTGFTQYNVTIPASADRAIVLVPDGMAEGAAVVAVISCHGRGGSETTVNTSPTIINRDAMLDAGYLVLSPDTHGSTWGNATAQADLAALEAWADGIWTVTDQVIMANSMGAATATLAVALGTLSRLRAVVMASPSMNLRAAWDRNDEARSSIRNSFGIATDGSDYDTKTAGWDALLRPASDYAGARFRMYASPTDSVASKALNADAFSTLVASTATEVVVVQATGGHVSSDHFRPNETMPWLAAVLAPDVPEPTPQAAVHARFFDGTGWVDMTARAWDGDKWVTITSLIGYG